MGQILTFLRQILFFFQESAPFDVIPVLEWLKNFHKKEEQLSDTGFMKTLDLTAKDIPRIKSLSATATARN